jgi:hypothetical protein
MDERPPGLFRAPWRLIEICESSLVRELSARPSVVAVSDFSWRNTCRASGWASTLAGRAIMRRRSMSNGQILWSMRVGIDQDAIAGLLTKVDTGDEVVWAVDLIGCETALLRAVLTADGHPVLYVPGRTVKMMSGAFAGEAKTDAP